MGSFWTNHAMNPKRNFRFKVMCKIDDKLDTIFYIRSINRPGFKIGEAVHNYAGHKFHFPGTVTWDSTITLSLVDPQDPDVAKSVMNLLRSSGYEIPANSSQTPKFITKSKGVKAISKLTIELLDGDKKTVEKWDLVNPWISGVSFSQLAYDQESLSDITLTVVFDYPIFTGATENAIDPTIATT